MEYIHSKDIFLLMQDTLKLVDDHAIEHGSRVAYYLYKMLEYKGGYEKYELADIVFLASLHDIGAYRTESPQEWFKYECRETMAHATYGYLYFRYLSPLSEYASVILHHHKDNTQLQKLEFEHKDIAACLCLAERVDVLSESMGDKFSINTLDFQAGTAVGKAELDLFKKTVEKYDVLNKVKKDTFREELDDIISYMIFSNEDKKKALQMLMFCQGLKSEASVVNTVTCLCIAEILGQKMSLSPLEQEQLYYGALLHDIGMLAMPKEILNAPRALTKEEYLQIQKHVYLAENVLKDRMAQEVIEVIATHHERGDGSGYPRRLRETQMNRLQQIVQLADTITALTYNRVHRPALPEKDILALLSKEAAAGRYNKAVTKVYLENRGEITQYVKERTGETLSIYQKLNRQYELVSEKLANSAAKKNTQ